MSQNRHNKARYLPSRLIRSSGLFDVYGIRIMLALTLSLSVILVLVNLPLYNPPPRIGWRLVLPDEMLTLEQLGLEILSKASPISPSLIEETSGQSGDGEDKLNSDASLLPSESLTDNTPELDSRRSAIDKLDARLAVFDFAEEMPQIVGGVGAYYINIEYPEAAAKAGIEGRLTLDFIVEPDGRTTNIRVTQPLHPLCDSAAVRALRVTRFVPGTNKGEKVRVRMRLPVRFQLIDRPPLNLPGES